MPDAETTPTANVNAADRSLAQNLVGIWTHSTPASLDGKVAGTDITYNFTPSNYTIRVGGRKLHSGEFSIVENTKLLLVDTSTGWAMLREVYISKNMKNLLFPPLRADGDHRVGNSMLGSWSNSAIVNDPRHGHFDFEEEAQGYTFNRHSDGNSYSYFGKESVPGTYKIHRGDAETPTEIFWNQTGTGRQTKLTVLDEGRAMGMAYEKQ
jgi:hypothetical protein